MPDTPVVSGNELTSNPGNANLGYSGGGVQYGANPAVPNPFEGMDNTLARIQQQDFQTRTQRHLEQRADIDELSKMLAQTNGSLFNTKDAQGNNMSFTPLPEDKKILDEQAGKLKDIVLNNPENYKTNPDFYKTKQELDYMQRHASVRAAFAAQQNQLASTEQDQARRQELLQNGAEQTGSPLTDYKTPIPLKEGPKFTNPLLDPKYDDKKNWQQFSNGIKNIDGTDYEVTQKGKPNSEIERPLHDNSTNSLTNSQNAMALWLKTPEAHNPAYIAHMNQTIFQNAQQRGINPVYAATVNPDGSIQYNPNPNEALVAHNIYSEPLQTEYKASDASVKQKSALADIADKKQAARLAWQKFNHTKAKDAREAAVKADEEYHTSVATKEVDDLWKTNIGKVDATSEKYYTGTPNATTAANDDNVDHAGLNVAEALKANGLNPSDYKVIKIPHSPQSVREMMGSEEQPKSAFFIHNIHDKTGENDLIAGLVGKTAKMKEGGEDAMKTEKNWKFVTKKDAKANKISSQREAAGTIKAANAINKANSGEEDTKTASDDENKATKTKVINGVTYELENGEWFKI